MPLRWKAKQTRRMTPEEAIVQLVERTQAVIDFAPDGTVLRANENFLAAFGYTAEEVIGQHHRLFVQRKFRESEAYRVFWEDLRAGKSFSDEFPRITKDDRVLWLSATYAPVLDETGAVVQITKIAREITSQRQDIAAVRNGLEMLGEGHLGHRITLSSQSSLGDLATAYNRAVEMFAELISRVRSASDTIDTTAAQIGTNSDELSRRTETQAATLEQTAAAVEQLNTNAKSAAEYALEVGNEAQDTRAAAEGSGRVVEDVTLAMQRIETSSDSIAQIISVIDDIAFQTNLLALNAGVEAARAGDAGRGFAVVAGEVRTLAQRSAESAQEIKTLISESGGHVKAGVDLVGRASTELSNIFAGVERISDRIREVVQGLNEQTMTLGEINTAISQLDTVTQQNAAMVNETSGAIRDLAAESRSLSEGVGVFRGAGNDSARGVAHTGWELDAGAGQVSAASG